MSVHACGHREETKDLLVPAPRVRGEEDEGERGEGACHVSGMGYTEAIEKEEGTGSVLWFISA